MLYRAAWLSYGGVFGCTAVCSERLVGRCLRGFTFVNREVDNGSRPSAVSFGIAAIRLNDSWCRRRCPCDQVGSVLCFKMEKDMRFSGSGSLCMLVMWSPEGPLEGESFQYKEARFGVGWVT